MISGIFSHYPWLWPLAWQSTACLAAGLGASFVLRRWPVRAHQLLLLALIAAVVTPALSQVIRHHQWGLLAAKPVVAQLETMPMVTGPKPGRSQPAGMKDTVTASVSAAQESDVAPAAVQFELARLVFVLWIAGSLILFIRLAIRFVLGRGLARRSEPVTVSHITDVIEAAKAKLGIEADAVISSSRRARSPLIWCWGRPLVLLAPTDACRDGDRLDWMSVVCHELAHWKRCDHVTGLFAELMVCVLPWQPLLWWTKHLLVSLSEEACDDWVIASGQVTTRYARTLLGLTPQGQAALVPAVVTSKKGLAGRVRRILQDKCASPHGGLRWTLAAVVLAGCVAVGIAFAQTRPSEATGTVKRITHHGAIVETLASAAILRGRALDPNNQPADDARIVALPMTCYHVTADKDGYFEVPCSPAWAVDGGSSCLMARDHKRKMAAVVEMRERTSRLTIHLEPGIALRGEVVDLDGRPVPGAVAIVWLADESRCQAPVSLTFTNSGRPGSFTIDALPSNERYKLSIDAEGYQTTELIVDTKDRSKDTIDIGTITMQPQDPIMAATAERSQDCRWERAFHQVYRIEKAGVLKLIRPPFILERQDFLVELCEGMPLELEQLVDLCDRIQFGYCWNGRLRVRSAISSYSRLSLVLRIILGISEYDFDLPKDLDVRLPEGDWIVRNELPIEAQLRALEEIIHSELHRSIRFEQRVAEQEVIVATGTFKFKPHPNGRGPEHIHLTWERDGELDGGGGRVDSLATIFRELEHDIGIKIVDETEPIENTGIEYTRSSKLSWIRNDPELKRERLSALLDSLAKTTSLQFKVERQPAQMWFVTEAEHD